MGRPAMSERSRKQYRGLRMVEADLVKELAWALAAVAVLVLLLAALFSSSDEPTLTAQQVAIQNPLQLVATALHILDGQNAIAGYGPPYNRGSGSLQSIGGFSPQAWAGVTIPIDAPRVFVLDPLRRMRYLDPALGPALATFESASPSRQRAWETAYLKALGKATVSSGRVVLPRVSAGPLPTLLSAYLNLARTGALEATVNLSGRIYQTDFTRALLLLQGTPLQTKAASEDLLGSQWGMMKEPGNYPGAVWLWFYTLLYQIPPYNSSPVADLLVGVTVGLATFVLLFVPWIPGLRDIPKVIPVYRLIWRRHYHGPK